MKNQSLKWIVLGFCATLAVGGVTIFLHQPEPPPPYQARVYVSTEGVRMPYRLYVPPNYDAKQKYPLVVWLHGYDAIGTDNLKQITGFNDAGARVWTEHWKDFPTLVVAPQSYERYWSLHSSPLPAEEPLVISIIAELEREFDIDPDRIYLAGQSMGGFGVWAFLEQRPDFYAAAIVLCGPVGPPMISDAHTIVHVRSGFSRARRTMSSQLQMPVQCSNHCARLAVIPDTRSTLIWAMSSDVRHSLKTVYYLGSLPRNATLDDKPRFRSSRPFHSKCPQDPRPIGSSINITAFISPQNVSRCLSINEQRRVISSSLSSTPTCP